MAPRMSPGPRRFEQSDTISSALQTAEKYLHRGISWWSLAPVAENVAPGLLGEYRTFGRQYYLGVNFVY